jgi:hypothetical protein
MDLQPDLTFAARRVVLRTGDLWLPQPADTSGPQIPREVDATSGAPR